jgi:hypothetical protein
MTGKEVTERVTPFMPLYTILLTFSYEIHQIFNVEHVSTKRQQK